MTNYMLTANGANGPRDVQVNNAYSILYAIELAEKITGRRVDHGRGGIGTKWYPAIIIDAETGDVEYVHDKAATTSMEYVNTAQKMRDN